MDKVREALAAILATGRDPARKHPDDSPAKGKWVTFTVRAELVAAAREALSEQPPTCKTSGIGSCEKQAEGRGFCPSSSDCKYAQPAPSEPAVAEFCCEHAWSAAKLLAWKERDVNCDCDHNEYCLRCWPLDFRAGGKWDNYAASPQPPKG